MELEDTLKGTYDAMTVRRVYGDPIESGGVTLIPAASIRGGLGIRPTICSQAAMGWKSSGGIWPAGSAGTCTSWHWSALKTR